MQAVTERYKQMRRAYPRRNAETVLTAARRAAADNAASFYAALGYVNRTFKPAWSRSTRYRWIENATCGLGWRGIYADEIGESWNRLIDHKGWYSSDDCSEVYRGIVYRLPGGRFLYGYADPNNPDCALIADDIASNERDAALAADNVARHFAEAEREYQEANNRLFMAKEKAHTLRVMVREAIEDVRALETCDSPRLQMRIKTRFQSAWAEYRASMDTLVQVLADVHPLVSYNDV
jgi:hypothetical protein